MNPALGPFAIAAVLLVVAGALKARQPSDTATALDRMGLIRNEMAVRASGIAELALGVAALAVADAVVVVLVAMSYGAFFIVVSVALVRKLPLASCGCFGKVDTPPSLLHLGIGLGALLAAVGMALDPAISPLEVVTGHFPASVAYVVLVAIGVVTSFELLTLLPRARAVARPTVT